MSSIPVLDVNLHGKRIGNLTLVQGDRSIFSFTQDYIDDPQRPTLSLSYKDTLGELLTSFKPVQTKVAPFFSNLLPEGMLRKYLAERAGVKESREFFLLRELGCDLPGAVSLTHDGKSANDFEEDDEDSRARDRHENALRFSLAGVQLKFSALKNKGKHAGLSIPAKGLGGSWIVKLPADRFEGVPENEYAMMSLARQIGIEIPEIDLVDVESIGGLPEDIGEFKGKAFTIRRFDRDAHGPVHIEDFAQVFSIYPDDKYKKASYTNIAKVLWIETDQDSLEEYIRRLVFSTLIGNADMHVKNWSLIYPDGRTPRLSPAYDLLSTIPYIHDKTAALNYARTKEMAKFNYEELSYMAAKAQLPENLVLKTAENTVGDFIAIWQKEKKHLGIGKKVVDIIDTHLATLEILRDHP